MIPHILLVGLGNSPLPATRHSLGHFIVDAVASRLGILWLTDKNGYTARGLVAVGETPVSLTLFKSKSLMNISGPSVGVVYRNTVSNPQSFILLSDSLSHKPSTLSVRLGGSANGHNGIRSVISSLGGETGFHRFRAGIGRDGTDAASYVLEKLSSHERLYWNTVGLERVLKEIEKIARANSRS